MSINPLIRTINRSADPPSSTVIDAVSNDDDGPIDGNYAAVTDRDHVYAREWDLRTIDREIIFGSSGSGNA